MASFVSNPDAPLMLLNGQDTFTLRQAFEGIHCFGAPGSGKTSGSGQTIARAYLRAGMGGLVLCSKPSEVERWQEYAQANGRDNSLVIFDETAGFNFIEYALARYGADSITNVVGILIRVLDDARRATGNTSGESSPFWDESIVKILKHSIPVLYSAYGTVTIESLINFAVRAPANTEKWKETAKNIDANPAAAALRKMSNDPLHPLPVEQRKQMLDFWMTGEWLTMDEKLRGNVISSYTSRLDLFRHGRLRDCFCGKTTIIPEMMFHGAVIVMAMPVQANETEGRLGQMVFKYMAQLAIESRNALPERHRERPVFIWVDEAHRFVSVKDEQFLAECRESRACCVFLSQGLPSYYAALGEKETKRVDGLIGKFSTQVFHQNACHHTNEFASKIIGRGIQIRRTAGVNSSTTRGGSTGTSKGGSRGKSEGMSGGTSTSTTFGQSSSSSTSRGMSEGGGESYTQGNSGGSSYSHNGDKGSSGSNSGWSNSRSQNRSWSRNVGSSHTEGVSSSKTFGVNQSRNFSTNESQSWGTNESQTWGESSGESFSVSEQMDNLIEPNYFATSLLSGGQHRVVTALWFRAGALFESGRNYMLVGFKQ